MSLPDQSPVPAGPDAANTAEGAAQVTRPIPDPDTPDPDTPERGLLVLRLLPNLVSILALCAGLTAIRFAFAGNVNIAVLLIALAAFLDGLDGRLARMLRSESAIGAELDSLCDFVNFGVVPALVLYFWGLRAEASMGWIAVLVYAVCCMLRLARFNVGNREASPKEKTGFIGVPSPAGAMLVLTPIYLAHVTGFRLPEAVVTFWMVAVGALMISRVPTPSLKRVRIPASAAPYALVGAVAAVALVITYPWVTLLLFSLGYGSGLMWHAIRHLRRNET
ncbi:CDP-diacylglycerol--serine O-phosphatidyltransferase [Xinfangfangia sp. D13-10-4-6]|uniref:CDP-diacylglycerol--serine O-phosphatidyltransferase n=1 Tax=Pseudogemmobacter hezensis TaxID=2737662 RepID=UPI00155346AF|nr:CDP-diacylglycerol--serine O-phosphatidyltransferase [Pseudogemmobacter hezensis]NPD15306.1 CDP-diacylglycerol--serine O-phosphatidyltransferase [Pseudogemmobacter hezensis]